MVSVIIPHELLSWRDALTIAVIIFAISQFMETNRLRRYLFYLGWLRTVTVVLVGLPLISVIIANSPPSTLAPAISFMGNLLSYVFIYIFNSFLNFTLLGHVFTYILSFSSNFILSLMLSISQFYLTQAFSANVIKLLIDPMFYQVVALSSFSLLILIYLAFLKNPRWFKPFFNIKLLDTISWELLDNMKTEDLTALCKIISIYLKKIVELGATVPRPLPPQVRERQLFNNEFAIRCNQFINIDLSGDNFIVYISRQNVKFIINIIEYAKKYSFWHAGNSIFFDNLFVHLLEDENSVLTREFKLGGYSGIVQPLSNSVFNSMELLNNYYVFGALGWGRDVSEVVLSNTIAGLDMALKHYLTTGSDTFIGNPGMKLGNTIERLGQCYKSICLDITPQDDEIWKNKYGSKMSQIMSFFVNLEYILTPTSDIRWSKPYNPIFSQAELEIQQYSLPEGIVGGFFTIYEGISWLKHEEYARMEAIKPYWLVFHELQTPVIKALQEKLLEKIKERVEENFKNHYPSMIKLFLNLYGGELYENNIHLNNSIGLYFREIFKSRIIIEIRNNKKFREHNMPTEWFFDKQNNICRMFYDNKKIIIDKATKKSQKPIDKKNVVKKTHKKK